MNKKYNKQVKKETKHAKRRRETGRERERRQVDGERRLDMNQLIRLESHLLKREETRRLTNE